MAYKVQLLYNSTKANNSGSTVPVKIQLLNAAGTNLSASGITVTVTGLSPRPGEGAYTLSFTAGSDPTTHTAQFVVS